MPSKTPPAPVGLPQAALYWLKLGFIGFGGPAGQISMMHSELVERRRWISERRFLHALNYCMLLPGPEATQLAAYIGWLMHGIRGGLVAGTLFVLPSLFILIILSWIYLVYGELTVVSGLLFGIKPAVTAIVFYAAYRIGSRTLHSPTLVAIALAAFLALFLFNVPYPAIVVAALVIGFLGSRVARSQFRMESHEAGSAADFGPALIDDETPPVRPARFTLRHLAFFGGAFLAIWGAVMAVLWSRFGLEGTLTQMGWFFTKAALLTFGGAYAVLPYIYQGGVEQYGWLTASQMIDGLALGETTPGPLIMVVAFIGFLGGWDNAIFGPQSLFLAGAAGAGVATFFTFLPSFLFIFLGAPIIESTHGELKLTAPLVAITAAVVGVVVNLAVFFAYHVLWPGGFNGPFSLVSALIGVAAAVLLFRFKVGIIPVVIISGLAGLAYTFAARALGLSG